MNVLNSKVIIMTEKVLISAAELLLPLLAGIWLGNLINHYITHRSGKCAVLICGVIVPTLLAAGMWMYEGNAIYSCCRSANGRGTRSASHRAKQDALHTCVQYADSQTAAPLVSRQTECSDCKDAPAEHDNVWGKFLCMGFFFLSVIGHLAALAAAGLNRVKKKLLGKDDVPGKSR